MLIHGFSLDNARLLKAFGTAFYAIIIFYAQTVYILAGRSNHYNMELNDLRIFF